MRTVFLTACVLCDKTIKREIALCRACDNDLPRISHACKQCGIPLSLDSQAICGQCIKTPSAVDYIISLFHYESPVDYMISELKFNQQLSFATIFGVLLYSKIKSSTEIERLPDVLLPVPLYSKRLVKRGFNQSLEIAKIVAKNLNLEVNTSLIKRIRNTRAQMDLSAQERKRNIKGCFEINPVETVDKPAYKHIVIVDDVVTTGSTVNEIASLLKKMGVETVGVWSIARAELR